MQENDRLENIRQYQPILPREAHIQRTIEQSKEVYYRQELPMHYREFLWTQFQYTRKRWWFYQAVLLLFASQILEAMETDIYRVRSLGVFGCLFVVFMIPELWRNKENDSLQIEAACFYSLRQVYSARITLFGIADVAMLTIFGFRLGDMGFTMIQILAQFLLPVTVTACICFSLLCGKQNWGESVSLAVCLIWSGLWWLILMSESMYTKVIPSVWMLLFGLALGFLAMAVCRTVRTTNQYWEVNFT